MKLSSLLGRIQDAGYGAAKVMGLQVYAIPPTGTEHGRGGIEIYGEQHYMEVLSKHVSLVRSGFSKPKQVRILLVREPHNPFDGNAIQMKSGSDVLGYVPREAAEVWAPFVDEAKQYGYGCGAFLWLTAGKEVHFLRLDVPKTPISQQPPWRSEEG